MTIAHCLNNSVSNPSNIFLSSNIYDLYTVPLSTWTQLVAILQLDA